MIILFPSNPITPKSVDESFGYEARAAKEAGFHIGRISLEAILGGEIHIAGCDEERGKDVLYRGWLMKPSDYERMETALHGRLVTTQTQYRTAYELPQWYGRMPVGTTPRTMTFHAEAWEGFKDLDRLARRVLDKFGAKPLILKDFVKSAKHRWYDACYIHDARDAEEVKRVVKNFLDIQAESLVGGLCLREFVPFKRIGVHSKTSQPLINEWRGFLSFGKLFYLAPYWAEGDYTGTKPTTLEIEMLAKPLADLPFVALDVAEHDDGRWMAVEFNDGGAAGVPEGGNTTDFFKALAGAFAST